MKDEEYMQIEIDLLTNEDNNLAKRNNVIELVGDNNKTTPFKAFKKKYYTNNRGEDVVKVTFIVKDIEKQKRKKTLPDRGVLNRRILPIQILKQLKKSTGRPKKE